MFIKLSARVKYRVDILHLLQVREDLLVLSHIIGGGIIVLVMHGQYGDL